MSNQSATPPESHVTLAVLAGGEGRRMGRPKAELQLDGRPILHTLLDSLRWPGPTLLVTAPGRQRPPGWERFSREASDPEAGAGPLRGLLTALEHAPTDLLLLTAVDMPGVGAEHLNWLAEELRRRPSANGLLLDRGSHVEPFPSAFRAAALGVVRTLFQSGERSMHALLTDASIETAAAPVSWPEGVWKNLNRPEDLPG